MAKPIKLHPKIRERKVPRITASFLAEFIIAAPDRQDTLLHDQRYSSSYVTPKHQQALRLVRSFCVDPSRDWSKYERGRTALVEKSNGMGFKPSQREEAARCVETLDLFREQAGNAFGALGRTFSEAPQFDPLEINGLTISVYPDLIRGEYPVLEGKKIGLVFMRPQKNPNPFTCKTESKKVERSDYRREILAYMLVAGDMMLRANDIDEDQIDRKRFSGWDIRLGEEVSFPTDRVSRERRIEAAAGQIARLWETIETKPGDLA